MANSDMFGMGAANHKLTTNELSAIAEINCIGPPVLDNSQQQKTDVRKLHIQQFRVRVSFATICVSSVFRVLTVIRVFTATSQLRRKSVKVAELVSIKIKDPCLHFMLHSLTRQMCWCYKST